MPAYEYRCDDCEVEFEELLLDKQDIENYSNGHPCPSCSQIAPRIMSSFAFGFKGVVRGTSGIHGNSGVHDLDYPTLDKAVARSSEKRWAINRERQKAIDEVRKTSGNHAVAMDNKGNLKPANPSTLSVREKAIPTFNEVRRKSDSK